MLGTGDKCLMARFSCWKRRVLESLGSPRLRKQFWPEWFFFSPPVSVFVFRF